MIFVIVKLTGYERGKNEFNEGTYADCVMDEFKLTFNDSPREVRELS